ncbi:MAG: sigma-54-dependent Fis family transcriptional regulator [Spirochaetales bacterium]|nr:sigma-54-dependent Fis family transcriptional regulator [Spirochaetales bacterium]
MKSVLPKLPILFVDDEQDVLETYKIALKIDGLNNFIFLNDSREVSSLIEEQSISVAVIDLFMPHIQGQQLLEKIKETHPEIPVIVVTGANEVNIAVDCMRAGAFDYIVKPVENSRLTSSIRRALEIRDLQDEVNILKQQVLTKDLQHPEAFGKIITSSERMKSIFKYIEAIAMTPKPVLITGESGVGKELIAHAIHSLSNRKGNFVPINVGGLDDTMFSDTLFGHKKGSFTGADSNRPGLIEQASEGTLFLDEIGDLDNCSQVKLLRLLQDREYYPLGSDKVKISDARIITATNTNLDDKQKEGTFRADLFFRLITHHIEIPPLSDRREDIPYLLNHFVKQAAESLNRTPPGIPKQLYTFLTMYDFPGNIRELQAIVYDAVSQCDSPILSLSVFKDYIEKRIKNTNRGTQKLDQDTFSLSYSGRFPTMKEVEDFFIQEAMKVADGNQSIAASFLGLNQSTLSRRLRDKK